MSYNYHPFNAFSSIVGGINAANHFKQARLQQQAQALRNQEAPDLANARAALLKAQLTHAQEANQFAPQFNQARLALLQAQNQGAQLKNQFIPQQMEIAKQNAQSRQDAIKQSQSRFGVAYALNKYMQSPQGKYIAAHNPGVANNIASYIAQTSQAISGAPDAPAPVITPAQVQGGMTSESQKLLKDTTDPQARSKVLYAANIDKTLNAMNPQALTQYAGIKGAAQKLAESAAAPFGEQSPAYEAYQRNLTLSKLLAKQVRQFYGDSIQPTVLASLQSLSNPTTWDSNPKLAMQKFNAFKNLLQKETSTYRSALQSPAIYKEEEPAQQSVPQGNVTVIAPNGQLGHIPTSQLKTALAGGYRLQQ